MYIRHTRENKNENDTQCIISIWQNDKCGRQWKCINPKVGLLLLVYILFFSIFVNGGWNEIGNQLISQCHFVTWLTIKSLTWFLNNFSFILFIFRLNKDVISGFSCICWWFRFDYLFQFSLRLFGFLFVCVCVCFNPHMKLLGSMWCSRKPICQLNYEFNGYNQCMCCVP